MAEITKLRKDTKHIAFAAPTESLDSVKHEAEAAKRLVTSRDAEIISLRRQVASLKRSLDQSQLQSSNQAVELTTVRSTLMQREDESIQKVKEAKEVSIKLRKQLTEALTKVAKAEENEQWLEDQDYPGQISAAERRLKDAVDNETVVKKKLHNANRTELSLYSKVKDLEQFTTDMEGNRIVKVIIYNPLTLINNFFFKCKLTSYFSSTMLKVFLGLEKSIESMVKLPITIQNVTVKLKSFFLKNMICT